MASINFTEKQKQSKEFPALKKKKKKAKHSNTDEFFPLHQVQNRSNLMYGVKTRDSGFCRGKGEGGGEGMTGTSEVLAIFCFWICPGCTEVSTLEKCTAVHTSSGMLQLRKLLSY